MSLTQKKRFQYIDLIRTKFPDEFPMGTDMGKLTDKQVIRWYNKARGRKVIA